MIGRHSRKSYSCIHGECSRRRSVTAPGMCVALSGSPVFVAMAVVTTYYTVTLTTYLNNHCVRCAGFTVSKGTTSYA
jgi:hypothetical protein